MLFVGINLNFSNASPFINFKSIYFNFLFLRPLKKEKKKVSSFKSSSVLSNRTSL